MKLFHVGIDIGSTTTKIAAVDAESKELVYFDYQRHHAKQVQSVNSALEQLEARFPSARLKLCLTGSGAKPLAESMNLPFVQEVVANSIALKRQYQDVGTAIELGGQDNVITIGRQCGSGGHTIGKMLAERLGVPFYDKEIIKAVAKKSGLTEQTVEKEGEYSTTSLLFNVATRGISGFDVANRDNMLVRDIVNAYQTEYIMELAEKGPCVIVGRSADYILEGRENCLNVFIHGNLADRAKRVVEEHGINPAEAEKHVLERDKKRAKYYRHITDHVWGLAENYDLCLNSSKLGIDGCVDLILDCCK